MVTMNAVYLGVYKKMITTYKIYNDLKNKNYIVKHIVYQKADW